MNAKTIGTLALLAFVAASVAYLAIDEVTGRPNDAARAEPNTPAASVAAPTAAPNHKVIAYYFHNTQRCMTCNKIERLAEAALRETFADALDAGELEWRTINMEDAPNRHFVEDYALVTSSLVLVDQHDGAQRAWVNMDKVWDLVHEDEADFKAYVTAQAHKYLES